MKQFPTLTDLVPTPPHEFHQNTHGFSVIRLQNLTRKVRQQKFRDDKRGAKRN